MKKLLSKINFKNKKTIILFAVVAVTFLLIVFLLARMVGGNAKAKPTVFSECLKLDLSNYIVVNGALKTREDVLKEVPYVINLENNCTENYGYGLYISVPKDKNAGYVKFIVTEHNTKNVIKEGNFELLNDMKEAFTSSELSKINSNLHKNAEKIYLINNGNLLTENTYVDLYFYFDKETLEKDVKDLPLGVVVKTYEIGD